MINVQRFTLGCSALALAMFAMPVNAALITNGDFSSNTGAGQVGFNTSLTDWSITGGYTFLYTSAAQAQTGSPGQYGTVALWGPSNGSANGFVAPPGGGAFIGADSAFQQAAITQTISGLIPGTQYAVSFYWAAAQQQSFTDASQSQWQVSLGSQTQSTAFLSIPSEGFSGWTQDTLVFTATSASEVLSFLANGSPAVPPFALLSDVTVTPTPEPESLLLLPAAAAFLGFGYFRRSRKTAKN